MMIIAHGRLVRCRMNTGEVLNGIWTRLNGAPGKQVIVSTIEMRGPPNQIEVLDDNDEWVVALISAVTAASPRTVAEMHAQGDIPMVSGIELIPDEDVEVFGASYVSVPLEVLAPSEISEFDKIKSE